MDAMWTYWGFMHLGLPRDKHACRHRGETLESMFRLIQGRAASLSIKACIMYNRGGIELPRGYGQHIAGISKQSRTNRQR